MLDMTIDVRVTDEALAMSGRQEKRSQLASSHLTSHVTASMATHVTFVAHSDWSRDRGLGSYYSNKHNSREIK